jgi:hypothetical protein
VCITILPVIKLEDILLNHKLEQMSENISTEVTLEGLHDPEEF